MKYYKNCVVLFAVMLFLLASLAPALAVRREPIVRSDAEYPSTPEKVVEEYVRKDADGYRLSGDKFRHMRDLYMWEEAGSDGFVVITGYEIETLKVEPEIARIKVSYREHGETSVFLWYPKQQISSVTFVLKRDGNRWRISEPEINPRVSLDTAINYLEHFVRAEPEEAVIETLRQLKAIKEREK